MNKIIRILIHAFFLSLPVSYCTAEQIAISQFFTKNEAATVLIGDIITKSEIKNISIVHTSNSDTKISIPVTHYTKDDLNSYEVLCIEKAFIKYELNNKSLISFYNSLAAFSKLQGMQYYSRLDKKTKTLITDCYRTDSPSGENRLEDNLYYTVKPEVIDYFKITDNRLGEVIFRSELYNEGNNFVLKNICLHPLEKFFIKINEKEEYQLISFFIYDKKARGYFYYAVNALKIRSSYFYKLGNLSAGSFGNRIRGNTVQLAKLLGLDWGERLRAFE